MTDARSEQPVVWTIAGSDSGGGAGIQADLHTVRSFHCHGCSVITTVTAQNSVTVTGLYELSGKAISEQLNCLLNDMPPATIKIGLLSSSEQLEAIAEFLQTWPEAVEKPFVVWDPVMITTQNDPLSTLTQKQSQRLLTLVDLITPNTDELSWLSGMKVANKESALTAASKLFNLGANGMLITGVEDDLNDNEAIADIYVPKTPLYGQPYLIYLQTKVTTSHDHGTGCTLSSAIAAVAAHDYPVEDAITLANAYVHKGLLEATGIGKGPGPVAHTSWPNNLKHFPNIQATHLPPPTSAFPKLDESPGLYPVVDSFEWVQHLLQLGVKTLQLRIKSAPTEAVELAVKRSIELAQSYQAQLFINDHWQLAMKHGAYGVHLGQEDLQTVDLQALRSSEVRLGISTHSYTEVLIASRYSPSYIALGHIFPTKTKDMPSKPQGLERLARYVALLKPTGILTVAIGGISKERIAKVKQTGVNGIALVSAITKAANTETAVNELNQELEAAHAD
ncbi:thiamine phosphate synthase [Idiomarina sp. X4]|uniref:thiamine phosphate synthase n=1 Tax=Idiomarina sp. X4 TaxID=2055892 RepID=UPI000C28A478|nr:thiamine phosphate synthase [Idiomarina sp. X4]ATZ72194.1 thiamine phosphate synthase [Idiomarina sp. X4]